MLNHGGGILAAAQHYALPLTDWLDLSTGLNPQGWPVPPIDPVSWLRLPETDDGLEQSAANYYGSEHLLAVAGSQAAIQALPQLRAPCRVGMLDTCYAEHPHHWQQHGHELHRFAPQQLDQAIDQLDVLLLCNPNNPTGQDFSHAQLNDWRQRLAARGGWLVLDEAFIDATPEMSLLSQTGQPGLIILRSIGKFFGLAGARVGFVFAWPQLLSQLANQLGPWTINGPARLVVRQALQDRDWQTQTRQRLAEDSQRLRQCLESHGLAVQGGTRLFHWTRGAHAEKLHDFLARRAILTRYFEHPASVRFGLPAHETDWQRLNQALAAWHAS